MIAGTRSGCGKTTLTLCLLAALSRRGLAVRTCKAGPDFIDPTHHAALTGRPSYNVDTWMGERGGARRVRARMRREARGADMLLAEGVMGLYDGARGMGGPGSTAHAARLLGLPVLLVADARGMGQSAAALAAGFVRQKPRLPFAGVVCAHVGSEAHQSMLREAFAGAFGVKGPPLLGLLPRQGLPELPSRHLGLLMAHEHVWDEARRQAMADWCETHLDMETLLRRCRRAVPEAAGEDAEEEARRFAPSMSVRPRIAVARDEAFCFLYPDMPDVLEEEGAETVFFSPLRDGGLPPGCAALYLPGGYPELHAERLAANASMREALRMFVAGGGRVYGECGGYMYLMESLEIEGRRHTMCGCLPLRCRVESARAALGYREVIPAPGSPFAGKTPRAGRGHEFHYARLTEETALPPLWRVRDRHGRELPPEGVILGGIAASWTHLYPEGARALLRGFIYGLSHA